MRFISNSLKLLLITSVLSLVSFVDNREKKHKYEQVSLSDSHQLHVPADLEISLWAESPMLYNPTNIDIDVKGRVWVTEGVNYRNFNNKPDQKLTFAEGDRVMILEDTDQDGKADKSKVFVQDKDLVAPLGIAVIGNKVVVSCAPNLIVYTDENGDDIPDKKEILLKGFGGLDHDHSLHSVTAGPDGRWHFNTGNAGPHHITDKSGWTLRSGSIYTGGTPYNTQNQGNQKSDDGRVWVGGLALRMNPDGTGMKVMAHNFRNSYEVAIDSYGNYWQNDNDDQVIACRTSWVMEGSNAGYFSADGTRYWQADRRPGQDMFTASWHQDDPGVLPAGDNTGAGSPTGMLVYEGDALGEKYSGMVLSCEAGRNVIWGYFPQPKGAGFDLSNRIDLVSTFSQVEAHYIWHETGQDRRKWFRPSDVATGTDGALYVADWYDPVVGGHQMHDKIGYGRIYRITPKNKKLTTPKIDLSATAGQIEALKNPAINVRNLGFEALKKQGDKILSEVKELLQNPNPYIQARTVWLMAQLGEKGKEEVEKILLTTKNEELKVAAFRAISSLSPSQIGEGQGAGSEKGVRLEKGQGVGLLREIAISLRDKNYAESKLALQNLFKVFDGKDRYYLEALGIGLEGKEEQFYKDLRPTWHKDPTKWTPQQAWLTWRIHPVAAVQDLKTRANATTLSAEERKRAITALAFVKDKSAVMAMIELSKSKLSDVANEAFYWVNFRKTNDWQNLIDWKQSAENELTSAQKNLIILHDKVLATKTLDTIAEKAIEQLALDKFGGKLLLTSAAEGKMPRELRKIVANYIFNNPDRSIRAMASDYFSRPSGKSLSVSLANDMPADVAKGKQVFESQCATCHKLGKVGAEIGPNLSLISKKFDKGGLLDAIVNPSASMAFGYEPWLIQTKDKQTYYGFLIADGTTVVLKDIAGKSISLKSNQITSRQQLKNSLMPDPSALGMKEKDLADLVGYILQFKP